MGVLTAEAIINLLADHTPLDKTLDQVGLMPVITLKYDTPISTIVEKMKRNHEYKVVITDVKGDVTGVLTEMDILNSYRQG